MNDEKCRFFKKTKRCHILVGVKCNGTKTNCSFYKTEEQFQRDCDRAIIINRRKCNCEQCRYSAVPCELSKYHEENDDNA
ncbi:MAG: hypothetical protein K2J47_01820 [Ruminococcus sp.]|nr:hypothetical protein [Ruminococcus sp.]